MESDELSVCRAVYETSFIGICVTDRRGCFRTVNDVFCDTVGYRRDALLGRPISMLIPDDLSKYDASQLRLFLRGGEEIRREWEAVHRCGDIISLLATSRLITEPDGRQFVVSTVMDITRSRQNEETLRTQCKEIDRLSRIASQTINGVIITDRMGQVEWINEGFTRISGYTLAEMKGRAPDTARPRYRPENRGLHQSVPCLWRGFSG